MLSYWYWNGIENAGDFFGFYLLNHLCGKCEFTKDNQDIVLCGSILGSPRVSNAKCIYGSGLIDDVKPTNKNGQAYKAVRGKLTHQQLIKSKIVSDKQTILHFDPGIMLSKICKVDVQKKYRVGVISHYVDEVQFQKLYSGIDGVKVISMKTSDIYSLAKQINECQLICSSSLHGVIFAHSYGIPAYHVENKPLCGKKGFKFQDYYSAYEGIEYHPFQCCSGVIPLNDIIEFNSVNREKCNPSIKQVLDKQEEFISNFPYKLKNDVSSRDTMFGRAVVTMTSWKKRIQNCTKVIQSVLGGTIVPDIVYLNLSIKEFPNRLKDLPNDLAHLTLSNPRVKINWVPGQNTRTFKKVFPILKYLNDDDVIITLDDDIIVPHGLVESRLEDFIKYRQPITSIQSNKSKHQLLHRVCNIPYMKGVQVTSLYTKRMLRGYEQFCIPEIIKFANDDLIYMFLLLLNGYSVVSCRKYSSWSNTNAQLYGFQQIITEKTSLRGDKIDNMTYLQSLPLQIKVILNTISKTKGIWEGEMYNKFVSYDRELLEQEIKRVIKVYG